MGVGLFCHISLSTIAPIAFTTSILINALLFRYTPHSAQLARQNADETPDTALMHGYMPIMHFSYVGFVLDYRELRLDLTIRVAQAVARTLSGA